MDAQYKEAARGCGMNHYQRLVQVELPLAMPTIIGGLRLSAVYTVSWTVLAAMIGLGGLGDFVYKGVSSNNNALILQGAIPAAILALVPMAMGAAEGAAEMMSDMSITMISGMVISTVITLLFTPVYYSVIDDLSHIFSRKKKKGAPPCSAAC